MAYEKVVFSSEVHKPMEYQVYPLVVKAVPESLGGGSMATTMYQTHFATIAIWKMNEQPLYIDIWYSPVMDIEQKPLPDKELELDWPMPTVEHCDLIAIVIFNAKDIRAITESDIPNTAYTVVIKNPLA